MMFKQNKYHIQHIKLVKRINISLLQAIREAHDYSKLDSDIQEILISAVKALKRGELPSYVSYELVDSLSGYFVLHLREKIHI